MNLAILLLQSANPLQNPLTPIILMVVIFYLVLFLPMRRRQKKADGNDQGEPFGAGHGSDDADR
jgi:hypothetical protein